MRTSLLLVALAMTLSACEAENQITDASLPKLVDCLAGASQTCSAMNASERRVYECSLGIAGCEGLGPDEQNLLIGFERKKPRRAIKLPSIELR